MGDEASRIWAAYDALLRRCLMLEEIADRLAVTCVDPIAVADFEMWKGGAEPRSAERPPAPKD